MKIKNIAVILNGGRGLRFGGEKPKQFTKLAGKTILEYTIEAFDKNILIDEILIVSNNEYISVVEEIILRNSYNKNIKIITGGNSRKESSYSAIKSLEGYCVDNDNLLFHDAVRPFVSDNIITNIITKLEYYNAIDVAIPVADTIIEVDKQNVIKHIPQRYNLRRGQTPQGFKYWLIKKSHELSISDKFDDVTDDCGLVLKYFKDQNIYVLNGEDKNIKITYPLDIFIANNLIQLGQNIKDSNIDFDILKNKINVIFGHTSGIGKSIYEILKKNKIKVYGFSKSTGIDISNYSDTKNALKEVEYKEGKIDNVIVTAGVLIKDKLCSISVEDITKQININYIGSVFVAKESIKYLEKTNGHLLLFGSSSYSRGRSFYSIYSSTKSALINFTQALAEEVVKKGIKVNILNPERTLTKMRVSNFGNEDEKTLLAPDNVANVALKIICGNLTGQIIDVKVSDFIN